MNTEETPPFESSDHSTKPFTPVEADDNVSMEEVSGKSASSKRKSGGGVMAALSLIVPVVLGGMTVFGAYFLFLEDWLKLQKSTKPKVENAASKTEDAKIQNAPVAPPQPTFAPPDQQPDLERSPRSDLKATQLENSEDEFAKREEAAANALRLAEKMLEIKPAAADSWFEKVVANYPDTKAARKASDWLKRRNGEP